MLAPKILVVDDSWTDLTLIATPLREGGCDVITTVVGYVELE
jgi:twitching motility two-component system response regulator PilH